MNALAVIRRFFTWRGCVFLAAFFLLIATLVHGQQTIRVTSAALGGGLAALTLLLYLHERAHPREVWTPPEALTAFAKRCSLPANAALAAALVANMAGVAGDFAWHRLLAVPLLLLTLCALFLSRLAPTPQKEPICTP